MWSDFQPFFGLMPANEVNRQVRYLIEKLHLKRGASFLDCPCGVGRVSIPMARKGIRVTGVDIHKPYLDEVTRRATRFSVRVPVHHCDMRKISFRNQFDAVGNLWTSFGFFEKESENELVVRRAYAALKPGGRFVIHVGNRDWILTHYQAAGWMECGDTISFDKRWFDYRHSVNHSQWRYLRDGKITEYQVSLRMYSYHELAALLDKVGFAHVEGFGSVNDEPITSDSRMMWIFGTKPKR